MESTKFKVSVITVSDRVSRGEAVDKSGPSLCEWLRNSGKYIIRKQNVVPDEPKEILKALKDNLDVDLILTSGGTGFGVRDITPEVVRGFVDKEAPGFTIAMITSSLNITPLAALSRPVCGVKQNTLIITLPGSSKGALENISALQTVIPHALELVRGERNAGESFHKSIGVAHSCVHHHSHEKIEGELSNDPSAPASVPAFRASIVDGYAVKSTGGTGTFKVQSEVIAGDINSSELKDGYIIRITTGAPVPNGADAVVMVEDTKLISSDGDRELEVEISGKIVDGQNIRPIGSDIALGEALLRKGHRITSIGGEIGMLTSGGVQKVKVIRKPIVAILSTGNELYDSSTAKDLKFGAVRDANRPTLKAALTRSGYEVLDLGIQSDNVPGLVDILKKGLEKADLIITTGGVSMGEKDLLKPVLERYLKATIHFGRVNLKPG
ncbi:hypothetical protein HDV01_003988 [Terramyces sp. JEL0728]|nr:hypothetical protein HDV01_003988 [Terramyces sp. JEL0728]